MILLGPLVRKFKMCPRWHISLLWILYIHPFSFTCRGVFTRHQAAGQWRSRMFVLWPVEVRNGECKSRWWRRLASWVSSGGGGDLGVRVGFKKCLLPFTISVLELDHLTGAFTQKSLPFLLFFHLKDLVTIHVKLLFLYKKTFNSNSHNTVWMLNDCSSYLKNLKQTC